MNYVLMLQVSLILLQRSQSCKCRTTVFDPYFKKVQQISSLFLKVIGMNDKIVPGYDDDVFRRLYLPLSGWLYLFLIFPLDISFCSFHHYQIHHHVSLTLVNLPLPPFISKFVALGIPYLQWPAFIYVIYQLTMHICKCIHTYVSILYNAKY